jgi:hypothetical protein
MWLAWLMTPKKKLVIAIVDKTVMSSQGQEHASLTWVLNHEKYTKTKTKSYAVDNDYFGFFPQAKEKYKIKGLERFSPLQIDQLSKDCDLAYYADTYGIYTNEWYAKKNITERSGIVYGGMSQQDIDFIGKMKANHKLIISEFNAVGSPTEPEIRTQFENMFGLKWSGWTVRFFNSLDTSINKEIPQWLIINYKIKNQGKWPFKQSGVAFVRNNEDVVILEEGITLKDPMPYIITGKYGQEKLGLPEGMKYSFWFDVMEADTIRNMIVSSFDVDVNAKGEEELNKNKIPLSFPAVIMHKGNDYEFYYFCGDFSDNPLSTTSSYFKGISFFKNFFYTQNDLLERRSFFWEFYRPLVTTILRDYYKKNQRGK